MLDTDIQRVQCLTSENPLQISCDSLSHSIFSTCCAMANLDSLKFPTYQPLIWEESLHTIEVLRTLNSTNIGSVCLTPCQLQGTQRLVTQSILSGNSL